MKLNFTNPLQVSTGVNEDILFVQLDLAVDYLPDGLLKSIKIPTQIETDAEAERISIISYYIFHLTKIVLAVNFVLNALTGGSLELIWSLVESLQIIQVIRLCNSRSPGNVNAFTKYFEEIARGKIFPRFLDQVVYIPELEPFMLNFMNSGYSTTLFLLNSQDFILNLVAQTSLIILLLLVAVISLRLPNFKKYRD